MSSQSVTVCVCVQCLMHLEDRLQEVYFKSQLLASACATTAHRRMNDAQIAVMLGYVLLALTSFCWNLFADEL